MKNETFNRYKEYLTERQISFVENSQKIWIKDGYIIRPFGPVVEDYGLPLKEARDIQKRLNGLLIQWTNGFNCTGPKNWYVVICKEFQHESALSSKRRSEIKRALSNTDIRRIDYSDILKDGYEVYSNAFSRYKNKVRSMMSDDAFKADILNTAKFPDLIEYWGVYRSNKLIGFSQNLVFDKTEVHYSSIKINPLFLQHYPAYALIYNMNKYYLNDNNFQYVNDGYKNVFHQTNIQNFLIDKFNFHKEYTVMQFLFQPALNIALKALFPFRTFLSGNNKLSAILKLMEISLPN